MWIDSQQLRSASFAFNAAARTGERHFDMISHGLVERRNFSAKWRIAELIGSCVQGLKRSIAALVRSNRLPAGNLMARKFFTGRWNCRYAKRRGHIELSAFAQECGSLDYGGELAHISRPT